MEPFAKVTANTEKKTILFLSADIVGATDFKQQHSTADEIPCWLAPFSGFFREVPLVFMGKLAIALDDFDDLPPVGVWRVAGDEIIFLATIRSADEASALTSAFVALIEDYDTRLCHDWGLRLRGGAWIADIPGENIEIQIPEMSVSNSAGGVYLEYLGPDVDSGFRLLKHAGPREVILSLKLACLLMDGKRDVPFGMFGRAPLNGLFQGRPYPILKTLSPQSFPALTPTELWEIEAAFRPSAADCSAAP